MEIGSFLKKIRLEKKYTLNHVAQKINITASLLSQIENEKITPSLHSLGELLKFYAINLSDFFKQVEQKDYIIVKKSESESFGNTELGYNLILLASKLQNNSLESYIVELQPYVTIHVAKLNKDINGERIIYILAGIIEIMLDDKNYFLEQGDSINFKSYLSCSILNSSSIESKILISGIPPIFI